MKKFNLTKKQLELFNFIKKYIDENGEQIPVPKITYTKDSLITK